jgi:drug/metabolite transporter (DMT)-like permease
MIVGKLILESGVNNFDLMLARSFVSFPQCVIILKCQNQEFYPDTLKNKRSKLLLSLKVILCIAAFTCFLLALNRLPIGILSVLDNTAPFWSMILGYFIFEESFSTFELVATFGAFIGVAILALSSKFS